MYDRNLAFKQRTLSIRKLYHCVSIHNKSDLHHYILVNCQSLALDLWKHLLAAYVCLLIKPFLDYVLLSVFKYRGVQCPLLFSKVNRLGIHSGIMQSIPVGNLFHI